MKRCGQPRTSVCVIQHVACETPGRIATVLRAHGFGVQRVKSFAGEPLPPSIAPYGGLVVMGGPMGVYEQPQYPFLRDELYLIEDAIKRGTPVLGVCLGSQLLAAALGAAVLPGTQKEIGWHSVSLTSAATTDALWHGQPSEFTALHWHGDTFPLPRGATGLAWSQLTACQAFRFGTSAYGLLFHLEVTAAIVQGMTRTFGRELIEAGISSGAILEGLKKRLLPLGKIGQSVFERWAEMVNQREA